MGYSVATVRVSWLRSLELNPGSGGRLLTCALSRRPVNTHRTIIMASQPVARDFDSRARAITHSASSPRRPFSLDIEANPHRNGSAPGSLRGRSPLSPRSRPSFEDTSGLQRRITRSNTVRNYHSPSRPNWEEPGAEPGVDPSGLDTRFTHLRAQCQITCVDFSAEKMQQYEFDNDQFEEFLDQPRPEWVKCRWININGLSWDVISAVGSKYKLHRLAIEDLMNTRGRTKADWYSDHAFGKFGQPSLPSLPSTSS
jgi:hypothetical protein